jgi:hypothetical protein
MKRFHASIKLFAARSRAKAVGSAPALLAIAVVFGATSFWPVARVWAFNPQPDPPAMAAVQILNSETAKLYAHCSPDAALSVNPGPCEVGLAFR